MYRETIFQTGLGEIWSAEICVELRKDETALKMARRRLQSDPKQGKRFEVSTLRNKMLGFFNVMRAARYAIVRPASRQ